MGMQFTGLWLVMLCQLQGAQVRDYLSKPDEWFLQQEAKRIADNVLSYQSELGGWPKNKNTAEKPYEGKRSSIEPTFDNGATTDELRFLARIYIATKEDRYLEAFERGLDYVLKSQYENGGWPQFYPPGNKYHRHITFNDNAMVRLLTFVREVATSPRFDFVKETRRGAAQGAFDKGIACILKCQYQRDGKRTAWCAQHDSIDFRPQSARTYELATLSGSESVGIVRLLMSIEVPSDDVCAAIESAVEWFRASEVKGIRVVEEKDPSFPKGKDKIVRTDPTARGLWARFYDLQSNQPVFADRDGVPKASLAEIGYERRNGYGWYGAWPQSLLEKEYPIGKPRCRGRRRKIAINPIRGEEKGPICTSRNR